MKPKIEKIFKRKDGLRVKVEASISTQTYWDKVYYNAYVQVCSKGKRKFRNPETEDEKATDAEIYEAKMDLYFQLRPIMEADF